MFLCCVNNPGKQHPWDLEKVAVNLAALPRLGNTGYFYSLFRKKKMLDFELMILFRKSLNWGRFDASVVYYECGL